MADETNGARRRGSGAPRLQILTQYVRDLSFENIAAQKGDRRRRQAGCQGAGQHRRPAAAGRPLRGGAEAQGRLARSAEAQVFILELDYAGLFLIQNVPAEQLHALLMIECPRLIFPYLRRIVGDVTRDGGYPPLNLEQIDFLRSTGRSWRAARPRRANAPAQA